MRNPKRIQQKSTYFIYNAIPYIVLDAELANEKLKSHKSPGTDQIPAELIKAGGGTIRCAIYKLIIATRVVPKLMPPIYFHGNYTRYKEHNNTI